MDETSVALWWRHPVGCVVGKARWVGGGPPAANVPADRKRGAATGAMVTHRVDLQPQFPQLLLGNKQVLSQSLLRSVDGKVSDRLQIWPEKSGWMTQALLCRYLHLVADVLAKSKSEHVQGIVVLDGAPAKEFCRWPRIVASTSAMSLLVARRMCKPWM